MKYSRTTILITVLMLSGAQWISAQSISNFPVAVGQTPQGYAVVNPTASPASVTFRLYSFTGGSLGTAALQVPALGQLSRLDTELFPIINHQKEIGWVQIEGPVGIQTFELGGNFVTEVDGGSPTPVTTSQVLPLFAGTMEIYGVNPGNSAISVQIQLLDGNGNDLGLPGVPGPIVRNIPAKGMSVDDIDVTATYGAAAPLYIRMTATGGTFLAGAQVYGFLVSTTRDFCVETGIDFLSQTTQLNFPHAVTGQLNASNYKTALGVINLSSSSQTVTMKFTPQSGTATTIQRTLPGLGALRDTIDSLFGLSGYQNGWIQVTGTSGITGFVAYADVASGGIAISFPQANGATELMFDHIADLSPWWTGIALLNPTDTDATVEVYAMQPSGSLIGGASNTPTARFTLAAKTKVAKLLSELIPASQTRASDGGFIYTHTTNAVPIFGAELFFLRNGAAFANVPAALLPPGVTYSPPQQ